MQETTEVQNETRANLNGENARRDSVSSRAARRVWLPSWKEFGAALVSALLLTLAFPDFDLWFVAWFALVPLFVVIAQYKGKASGIKGFLLGWLAGTIFFYASCWWVTYSSIHYGGLPAPLAYALLIIVTAIVGIFPAFAVAVLARACRRWGVRAMLLAAPIWTTFEWLRFISTNQLWNAVGYSQSFKPVLIQAASFGGVFAVSFLVVAFNSALALVVINQLELANSLSGNVNKSKWGNDKLALVTASIVALIVLTSWMLSPLSSTPNVTTTTPNGVMMTSVDASQTGQDARAILFAIQPNIAIKMRRAPAEFERLTQHHFAMSREAVRAWEAQATTDAARNLPRIIIFPESPMNFAYGNDTRFRQVIGDFARELNAAILFNSQEPDRRGGVFNAAVLVDRRGNYVAQYDKMQLLPFGEYVPAWLPGSSNLSSLVGNFTSGENYSLLPVGDARGGVFICIESAFPEIARNMTRGGAEVLINISNDAYLGDTPVARQHLANSIFRAVENRRPVIRVTNTGISTYITARGDLIAPTETFVPAVQTWLIKAEDKQLSLYTRAGDFFIFFTLFVTLMTLVFSFVKTRSTRENQ